MTPTYEQQLIINAFNNSKRNLIIRARAGAAKTTTLRMLIEEHPRDSLYLAFNKSVVVEARTKVPQRCRVMTLNGIGHQTLARNSGVKIDLDTRKNFKLLYQYGYREKDFSEVLRAVRLSKHHGFVPSHQRSLMDVEDFFHAIDMRFSEKARTAICHVIDESWSLAARRGIIDFDDQILIPTLSKMSFPYASVVFVDEAQDLSAINQRMVKLIAGIGIRLVAVGDDAQAIYGFRGADHESMNNLQNMFKMESHMLTMTFRCSKAVTEHANWRTQDMKHAPNAVEGKVQHMRSINFEDIGRRTAILCRNNAPLVSLTLRLIYVGYTPKFLGRDILDELVKTLDKITSSNMTAAEGIECIGEWEEEKKRTWKSGSVVADKAECMRLFLRHSKTVGEGLMRVRQMQDAPEGNMVLSTIHKSKGAEYDDVIIIDPHLIHVGTKEKQEDNLLYVAQTRARNTLRYCKSERVDAHLPTEVKDG